MKADPVRGLADLALRRIRLLTAATLIGGLWLIVTYDLSWHAAVITAAILAMIVAAVLGIQWLSHGRGAGPRAES